MGAEALASLINTMLIQIALLAWLFLGFKEVLGLGLAALGVLALQLGGRT